MTTDPAKYGDRESVRLPLWLASFAGAGCTFGVAVLTGSSWRPSLAGVLAGLGSVLTGTEVARGRSWSPASVWNATVAARADEAGTNASFVPVSPAAWGSPEPAPGD